MYHLFSHLTENFWKEKRECLNLPLLSVSLSSLRWAYRKMQRQGILEVIFCLSSWKNQKYCVFLNNFRQWKQHASFKGRTYFAERRYTTDRTSLSVGILQTEYFKSARETVCDRRTQSFRTGFFSYLYWYWQLLDICYETLD